MPPTSHQHNPNRLDEALGEVTSSVQKLPNFAQTKLTPEARSAAVKQLASLEALLSEKDPNTAALTVTIEELEATIEYASLPVGIQAVVPRVEYSSPTFVREASERGFTPFQWAGVQGIVRQARPEKKIDPQAFSPAPDGRGLIVTRVLDLAGCTALTALPEGLMVGGSLALDGCTALAAPPAFFSVAGELRLSGSSTTLQQRVMKRASTDTLSVGSIIFGGTTFVPLLVPHLTIPGDLDFEKSTSLTMLPPNLTVEGDCYLAGCTALTSLPDNLTVKGDLSIARCSTLMKLPVDLSVEGDLFCYLCSSELQAQARKLHAREQIYGDLHFE